MSQLTINSKVTLNNGVKMPVFGLGMFRSESGSELVSAVSYALSKANYRLLDSAQIYKNEPDVGEGIRASGIPRESIFVTTKLFTTAGGRQHAIEVIENSLKLMNIDYIDQYLLHAPQGGHVLECYDVLLEYQKKGLVKSIGVSNFGIEHLEALKNSGRPLPQVNQIELHPWCYQEDIVNWCRLNGVSLVGYCPLAKAQRLSDPLVVELAKKYSKTPAQILIRWSLQKGFITIPKSINPSRISENANVFDFKLSDTEMARFKQIGSSNGGRVSWNPTNNSMHEFGPTK